MKPPVGCGRLHTDIRDIDFISACNWFS